MRDKIREYGGSNPKSISAVVPSVRKRVYFKAVAGRGRRRSEWISYLCVELLSDFMRLKAAGVKFSPALIGQLARTVMNDAPVYDSNFIDPVDNKPIVDRIKTRWVQQFTEVRDIAHRTQTGKLLVSAARQDHIAKTVASRMDELRRGFESGDLSEDLLCNMDETHFVINCDNRRVLRFRGDTEVKYADVVSGGIGMTMMLYITGGSRARIGGPMMIFQNPNRSYPITGLPDDVPGVSYRSGPIGWNDKKVFFQWFGEPRAFKGDSADRRTVMYVDNCGGHNASPELRDVLLRTNTELRYFPPCVTDLVQPADSFVISKIKDEWTRLWEAEKMRMIKNGDWSGTVRMNGSWSEKLKNPGKRFFLELAAKSVHVVNGMRDSCSLTYARKAMIRFGMAFDVGGRWHESQLTPELQQIIGKYRIRYDGTSVPAPGLLIV